MQRVEGVSSKARGAVGFLHVRGFLRGAIYSTNVPRERLTLGCNGNLFICWLSQCGSK